MASSLHHRCASPRLGALVRACLLACGLLAAGCVPGMHELEMPARDTAAREQAILDKTSDGELMDRGREQFLAGRFDAAARRFAVLRERHPGDLEATVRLGLALWFEGRPAATAALWNEFSAPDTPDIERLLAQRASALTLLSRRLAARRILADLDRGRLVPGNVDGLVLLPAAEASPAQASADQRADTGVPSNERSALPDMNRALAMLLQRRLADSSMPPADHELVRALREELGRPLPGDLDESLDLARALGAGYAATVQAEIPEEEPDLLRTTFKLTIAEPPRVRELRLNTARRRAEAAWSAAEAELRRLEESLERCAAVLDYFRATERLSALLAQRDEQAETITRLNREGDSQGTVQAMREHQQTEADMAALQAEIKEYERTLVLGMDGSRRFTAEAYRDYENSLVEKQRRLEERLGGLRKAAWQAVQRTSVFWPPNGRSVTFDMPLEQLASWPDKAARKLAELAGEAAPGEAASAQWDLAQLQQLDKALTAWDNGEYAAAEGRFDRARAICPEPPVSPGDDFDLLRLAELPPHELAARFLADFSLPLEDIDD